MTLQELIDELSALRPLSARGAPVCISMHEEDFAPLSVRYEGGVVVIQVEGE